MTKQELLKIAKPISFNTEMVQAILGGHKSVTRRIIKPQPTNHPAISIQKLGNDFWVCRLGNNAQLVYDYTIIPRYQVGDYLYVQEGWQILPSGFDEIPPEMNYTYEVSHKLSRECTRWRSCNEMSKEAARIFLKVTEVRAERLQDIEASDIECELGILPQNSPCNSIDCENYFGGSMNEPPSCYPDDSNPCPLETMFIKLWDEIYKKRGYGWDANPWGWVYKLERVKVTK